MAHCYKSSIHTYHDKHSATIKQTSYMPFFKPVLYFSQILKCECGSQWQRKCPNPCKEAYLQEADAISPLHHGEWTPWRTPCGCDHLKFSRAQNLMYVFISSLPESLGMQDPCTPSLTLRWDQNTLRCTSGDQKEQAGPKIHVSAMDSRSSSKTPMQKKKASK